MAEPRIYFDGTKSARRWLKQQFKKELAKQEFQSYVIEHMPRIHALPEYARERAWENVIASRLCIQASNTMDGSMQQQKLRIPVADQSYASVTQASVVSASIESASPPAPITSVAPMLPAPPEPSVQAPRETNQTQWNNVGPSIYPKQYRSPSVEDVPDNSPEDYTSMKPDKWFHPSTDDASSSSDSESSIVSDDYLSTSDSEPTSSTSDNTPSNSESEYRSTTSDSSSSTDNDSESDTTSHSLKAHSVTMEIEPQKSEQEPQQELNIQQASTQEQEHHEAMGHPEVKNHTQVIAVTEAGEIPVTMGPEEQATKDLGKALDRSFITMDTQSHATRLPFEHTEYNKHRIIQDQAHANRSPDLGMKTFEAMGLG